MEHFACFDVVLALAAVLALSAFLTLHCSLHAALAPLCSLSLAALVLTLGGMAGALRPAGLAFYGASYALGALALLHALRQPAQNARGRLAALAQRLLPPGAAAFWFLTLAFTVYFGVRKTEFLDFDEFSLWGTAAKITSTQNVLYTEGRIGWIWQATQNCGMMVLSYFIQLFGAFAAWKTYAVYAMLLFACFAAVLGGVEWKDYALAFPMAALCWLAPFFFTVYGRTLYLCHIYMTAYADIQAGAVFGAAVVYWFVLRRQQGPFWTLLPVLMLAANLKSNTFVLSIAAAGLIAADLLLFGSEAPARRRGGLWQRLAGAAAVFAAPLAIYALWNRYTAALVARHAAAGGLGSTSEALGTVAVSGLKMLLGLPVGAYYEARRARYAQALSDMWDAFLHTRLTMIGPGRAVTGMILVLFALAVLFAPDRRMRGRIGLAAVLSTLCFAAYNFMLVLSYAFIFTEAQGRELIDYNRYLYTYYLGWFLLALALLGTAVRLGRRPLAGKAGVLVLACLFALCFGRYVRADAYVLGYNDAEYVDARIYAAETQQAVAAIAADPARTGSTDDQRVFLVSQGDNGLRWFQFSYDFLPLVLDYSGDETLGAGGGTFGLAALNNGDAYYHAYTAAQFDAAVRASGSGYIFVEQADAIFTESYAALFSDGLAAAQSGPALYRVETGGFVPLETEAAQ